MKKLATYREADGSIIQFESHTSLKSPLELARYYAKEKNYSVQEPYYMKQYFYIVVKPKGIADKKKTKTGPLRVQLN